MFPLKEGAFFYSNHRMSPFTFFCMMPKYEHITIFSSVLDL